MGIVSKQVKMNEPAEQIKNTWLALFHIWK